MEYNYHCHTYRCGHAIGTNEEIVKEAIKNGLKIIGISEHMHHKSKPYCMSHEEYLAHINELQALRIKYANNIQIYIGLECEYIEGEEHIYEEFLADGVDYLILGNHFSKNFNYWKNDEDEKYQDYIINARKAFSTGYFCYFAHPDLVFVNHMAPLDERLMNYAREIIQIGIDFDIPLEINCEGIRDDRKSYTDSKGVKKNTYPRVEFIQLLATSKAKAVIGADSHNPLNLNDKYVQKAYVDANNYHINLIKSLDFKRK